LIGELAGRQHGLLRCFSLQYDQFAGFPDLFHLDLPYPFLPGPAPVNSLLSDVFLDPFLSYLDPLLLVNDFPDPTIK